MALYAYEYVVDGETVSTLDHLEDVFNNAEDALYRATSVAEMTAIINTAKAALENLDTKIEILDAKLAALEGKTVTLADFDNYLFVAGLLEDVIASDILPVLRFVNGFTAAKSVKMNGPYKVGELDGMNVYVSPIMTDGEFFLGLNGSDMMSSAGVYAPYMAIVPTQLLGTPDGGMAQGFSTWYAKALLNDQLLVAGKVTA
jgi:hypothetical protein